MGSGRVWIHSHFSLLAHARKAAAVNVREGDALRFCINSRREEAAVHTLCVCPRLLAPKRGGGWKRLQWFQVRSKILAASLKERGGELWETFRLDPQKNLFIKPTGTKPKKKKEGREISEKATFDFFSDSSSFMTGFQFSHV